MQSSKHWLRMLEELIECGNSIKKTQAGMKVALSEIKKNLQGTNSGEDEADNQIKDLERKEEKKHSIRTARRRKLKKKNTLE